MVSKLTKRALAASLKKLLAQKPLSKITIADITEDCGMNRMTFYYHFQDIYDLIDWICQEEGERAFQGRKGYNTWQEGFIALCHAVIENQAFILGVYRSVQREQVENYLGRVVYRLLLDVVEDGMQAPPEEVVGRVSLMTRGQLLLAIQNLAAHPLP